MVPSRRRSLALVAAVGLAGAWTFATWLLEGRIHTLLRPEAIDDRLIYLAVANVLVGLGGAALLVRHEAARGTAPMGMATPLRTAAAIVAGGALGALVFFGQHGHAVDPWVLINAHAQVWTVTVAEIAVCWWALGTGARATLPAHPRWAAALTVGLGAVVFGLYHFGHSPPFDTWPMVGTLTLVGLATGIVFVVSGDLWGAAVFHNWAAVLGVTDALAAAGVLDGYRAPRWPTLISAALALALLLIADRWVRRAVTPVDAPPAASR